MKTHASYPSLTHTHAQCAPLLPIHPPGQAAGAIRRVGRVYLDQAERVHKTHTHRLGLCQCMEAVQKTVAWRGPLVRASVLEGKGSNSTPDQTSSLLTGRHFSRQLEVEWDASQLKKQNKTKPTNDLVIITILKFTPLVVHSHPCWLTLVQSRSN